MSAEPARAHVDVQPGIVEQGVVNQLLVELPQLRPGPPPKRLGLRGGGVQLLDSTLLFMNGSESRWIALVRVDTPLGPLHLTLRAIYADGEAVEVGVPLTVVPAAHPAPTSFPWAAALVGALVAIGAGFALLRRARRKSW